MQIQILYSLRITTCNQHEVNYLTILFFHNNTKWQVEFRREKVSFGKKELSSKLGRIFFIEYVLVPMYKKQIIHLLELIFTYAHTYVFSHINICVNVCIYIASAKMAYILQTSSPVKQKLAILL